MTPVRTRDFLIPNGVLNRVLIPLLNSAAGGTLGRRLAIVEYLGRRTGYHHQLVTHYVTEGRTVRISVGMAERKTWWRNFDEPHPMRLRLAGVEHDVFAHLDRDGNQLSVIAELEAPDNKANAPAERGTRPAGESLTRAD